MKKFLAQRWFLLLLIGGVGLAFAWPATFAALTSWLEPRLVIALALLLMAWTMPSRSLAGELRRPWAALWAVAISYGFLPGGAWILGSLAPLPDIRIGLLLSASVPCTLASAVLWTRLAGGNEATALLTVVISTLSSWLATTTWLVGLTGTAVNLDAGDMMLELIMILVLPVLIGQGARAWRPLAQLADRGKLFLSILAQILVLSIVLKAASAVGLKIAQPSASSTLVMVVISAGLAFALHLLALGAGWQTSAWLGFDRPRRIAVAIACSQKTLPVSLTLFDYFKERFPLAVVPLLFYHVGQLIIDTFIADRLRRQTPDPV